MRQFWAAVTIEIGGPSDPDGEEGVIKLLFEVIAPCGNVGMQQLLGPPKQLILISSRMPIPNGSPTTNQS